MGTLNSWTVIDANNNAAPPDGWPENTMNYADVNDAGRAVQGTLKRFFADINGSLVAGGVADAYTVTLNETGYTAYFAGMYFACKIPAASTTGSPTINVNGIGAAAIVDASGASLAASALQTNGIYSFRYDGTNFRISAGGVAFLPLSGGTIAGNLTLSNGLFDVTQTVAGSRAGRFYSDTASRTAPVVDIINDNATGSGVALRVQQDQGGDAIFSDAFNSFARAAQFYSAGSGRTVPVVEIINDSSTGSGVALRVQQDQGGDGLFVESFNAGARSARFTTNIASRTVPVVDIINDDPTGSGVALRIQQDQPGAALDITSQVTGRGILVTSAGNGGTLPVVDINQASSSTGVDAFKVTQAAAAGRGVDIYTNVANRTVPLVDIVNDNATGSGAALRVQQDQAGNAIEVVGPVGLVNMQYRADTGHLTLGIGLTNPRLQIDSGTGGNPKLAFQQNGTDRATIQYFDASNKLVVAAGPSGLTLGQSGRLAEVIASSFNLASATRVDMPTSTTSNASIRIPHGSAPTAPVNGDMWTTTAGLFVRINGVTVGPVA